MTPPHDGPTGPPPAARRWYDAEAGPLVRPYAMTGGRTRPGPRTARFDLIALVIATAEPSPDGADETVFGPEHHALLALCRAEPQSVADLAAEADLAVGVVRVLLGDLLESGLIHVTRPAPATQLPDEQILREVINGLRAL